MYIYAKSLDCIPQTNTVLYDNYIMSKIGKKYQRHNKCKT